MARDSSSRRPTDRTSGAVRLMWCDRQPTFTELSRRRRPSARRRPYTNNDIARYEGFNASVVYSYFAALGYEIAVEDSSSHSRLDMAVRTGGHVYLFEFKVVEMASLGSALAQLRERDYAAKYRGRGEPIHLIGVEFSRERRNVTVFEVADG